MAALDRGHLEANARAENVLDCESVIRSQLLQAAEMLDRKEYTPGTVGNLSARLDESRIIITPTGRSKGRLAETDLIMVDMDGHQLSGIRKPSSELEMHLTIYRNRADVLSVIHAHPPTATGFASAGIALDQPIYSELVMSLGSVPLANYATTGTPELQEVLTPFIGGHDAILMANHGAVTYGGSVEEAYLRMDTLEHCAKVVLVAFQLGSMRPLDKQQLNALVTARTRYKCGALANLSSL